MIYIQLLLTFLKIGTISFGGGYGMVAVLFDEILSKGWMSSQELTDMIAVSESTPGPIAVNMATFVGSKQAGLAGGLIATFGVVLPAFIIILLISTLLNNLMKYKGVQAFLNGIRPCVVGLIVSTAVIMLTSELVGVNAVGEKSVLDYTTVGILTLLIIIHLIYKKKKNTVPSPIIMIVISALLGIAVNII